MATRRRIFSNLTRTISSFFRIGTFQLKDNGGNLDVRDFDDTVYVDVSANDLYINSVQFDLSPTVTPEEGRLFWDDDDGTLEFGLPGGSVSLQIGQENVLRVRNVSGSLIANGSVVYISGANGNRPTIDLATAADHEISDSTIGIATEDIDHNENGYITTFGLVRDVNTSIYNVGDKIFLSTTAGEFDIVEPTPPDTTVGLGVIVVASASGVIFVNTDTIHNINELSDTIISGISQGDILYWDNVTSVWRNASYSDINYTVNVTGDITLTGGESTGDIYILADTTSNPITITLPIASNFAYRKIVVKKIDVYLRNVIIDGNGATIDGYNDVIIQHYNESLTFYCDGSGFYIV